MYLFPNHQLIYDIVNHLCNIVVAIELVLVHKNNKNMRVYKLIKYIGLYVGFILL